VNALTLSGSSSVTYQVTVGAPSWTGVLRNTNQLWVIGTQLVSGSALQPQVLTDFPFDIQNAQAIIESSMWVQSVLTFQGIPSASTDVMPDSAVEGWTILGGSATLGSRLDNRNGFTWHRATFSVKPFAPGASPALASRVNLLAPPLSPTSSLRARPPGLA